MRQLLVAILLILGLASSTAWALPSQLAAHGKANFEVVVSANASTRVKEAANSLSHQLTRLSGAPFVVKTGDGKSGIAVGAAADFPALALAERFNPLDPLRQEEFLLQTHTTGAWLIGSGDLAVEHAVWDFLHRLGHRHFFPGDHWEVVPAKPVLTLDVEVFSKPDYTVRRIWYGFGGWPENNKRTALWRMRNKANSEFTLNSSHAYGSIIKAFKEEFQAHPEYLSHVDGKPTNKINIAEAGARKLAVQWALNYFEKNPTSTSIGLDPSDGGGWGQSAQEQKLGTISDRVVLLANEVADAVNARFAAQYGTKYVGIYAYNEHSAPPTIKVHPNVIVSVATSFNRSGLTIEELIEQWQKQGARIGMREYYALVNDGYFLPTKPRASNVLAVAESVARYHRLGAQFMSAEAADAWGPCGLGFYVATRMMWDTRANPQAIIDDFFENAFGQASGTMREFYTLMDSKTNPTFGQDTIGKMFSLLKQARSQTADKGVHARLDDLILYMRYCDLFWQFSYGPKPVAGSAQALKAVIEFTYRSRDTHMTHNLGLWRWLNRFHASKMPADTKFNIAEDKNPWKSSAPFTQQDIQQFVTEGIGRYPVVNVDKMTYCKELVPITALGLPRVEPGKYSHSIRSNNFYIWVSKGQQNVELGLQSGMLKSGAGEVEARLYNSSEALIDQAKAPKDKEVHNISLKPQAPGLHRIEIADGASGTSITWPQGAPFTTDSNTTLAPRWTLYFYVPKGTKSVGGYSNGPGQLRDANGKMVHSFAAAGTHFSVPVEPGQDGKLWQLYRIVRVVELQTVPPYMARSGEELLLPREVVVADAKR